MNFDLVTPCDNCPFLRRGGVRLRRARIDEIAQPMLAEGAGAIFPCHKTVKPRRRARDRQMCAGALLFSLNHRVWTQPMQLAERLLGWDATKMRGHDRVFPSLAAMRRTAI